MTRSDHLRSHVVMLGKGDEDLKDRVHSCGEGYEKLNVDDFTRARSPGFRHPTECKCHKDGEHLSCVHCYICNGCTLFAGGSIRVVRCRRVEADNGSETPSFSDRKNRLPLKEKVSTGR